MTKFTTWSLTLLAAITAKEMPATGEKEDEFGAEHLETTAGLTDRVVMIESSAADVAM